MSGERAEHRASEGRCEHLELGARRPRFLELAGDQQDLAVRRQERGSLERVGPLSDRAAERAHRCLDVPLGESKLGEPGLRLPAVEGRVAVGILGRTEVALQTQGSAW
jgi:hypothetical protein